MQRPRAADLRLLPLLSRAAEYLEKRAVSSAPSERCCSILATSVAVTPQGPASLIFACNLIYATLQAPRPGKQLAS